MKIIFYLITLLACLPALAKSDASFGHTLPPLFGIRAGAEPSKADTDYDRAEKAIFHGIEVVEQKVQKAVEDEVHSIFDAAADDDHHDHAAKTKVVEDAKSAVSKASGKVKQAAQEHSKARLMPFLPKHLDEEVEHHDHKILHAVEAAEQAVLHAVQEEVDSIFHGLHDDDDPKKTTEKAKKGVKEGVKKAKKHVEDTHKERSGWMQKMDAETIDEYIKNANSMYGMGF